MSYDEESADDFERQLALRLHNASPYLADAGFTAAVMQKLPRERNVYTPSRSLVIMGSLLALITLVLGLSQLLEPLMQWIYSLKLAAVIHLGLYMLAIMITGVLGWLGRRLELL